MKNGFSVKSIDGVLTKGIYSILLHTYVWQNRSGQKGKEEKLMNEKKRLKREKTEKRNSETCFGTSSKTKFTNSEERES